MDNFFGKRSCLLDFLNLGLILLLTPLFFYKLGQSSLVSWDEAWYGEISKHILLTGDLFNLVFNNHPFVDHPPGGFWITAIFFKFLGISEFSARFSSAFFGVLSLILTYLLGKKIFNRVVGFSSALALCSSFWFLYRARSGNLDTPLIFFFLLTFYLAIKASENRKYFLLFGLTFAYLTIIKVFAPFLIIPSLVFIFWRSDTHTLKDFIIPIGSSILLYGLWLLIQYVKDPNLVYWHFFNGIRRGDIGGNLLENIKLFNIYLHNGIGKWFWPGVLGTVLVFFLKNKYSAALPLFILTFSLPFFFSPEVHIWHLIPVYPFMILSFFGAFFMILVKLLEFLRLKRFANLISIFLLIFSGYFSFIQLRAAWYQFIDISAFVTDEAILSKEAQRYQAKILYIDGDFDPAAAFYSDKEVKKLKKDELKPLVEKGEPFLIITNTWRLKDENIPGFMYEILKTDRDKVLIKNPTSRTDSSLNLN